MNLKLEDAIRSNIIKIVLAVLLFTIPLGLAIKWSHDANTARSETANYQQADKTLKTQIKAKQAALAKRNKHIPNTYQDMLKATKILIKAQTSLMNSNKNYSQNIVNLKTVLSSLSILDNPHAGLIVNQAYTKNLKITPSYAPSVKSSDDTIRVDLLYTPTKGKYKDKLIYLVQADYSVLQDKFTKFNTITTSNTPLYVQDGMAKEDK